MKDLKNILERMGYTGITTYIQSGNVIFQNRKKCSKTLAKEIGAKIMQHHGFEPAVIVLQIRELQTAFENNPFSVQEGKALHFYFLSAKPENPDLTKLAKLKSPTEDFVLDNKVFYLRAPDGIGRSRLAAAIEQNLSVKVTARNLNTVNKLISLAKG